MKMGFLATIAVALQLWDSGTACAQANPVTAGIPCNYRNAAGGADKSTSYPIPATATNGAWLPPLTGWNNRNTSAGNKIENFEVGGEYDFTIAGGGDTVTADKSKYFWTAHLPGWTFKSAASLKTNCYAYCTGKDYWIQPAGFNVLMQDEYEVEEEFCMAGCIMKQSGDHCLKLEQCCSPVENLTTIKKMSQKINTSPVYEKTFSCPQGHIENGGTVYCKK